MSLEESPIKFKLQKELPGNRREVLRLFSSPDISLANLSFLKEVKKLPKQDQFNRCRWVVEVDHLPIRWIQKTIFKLDDYEIHFELEEGDLKTFSGKWILLETSKHSTAVTLEANVALGIPFFEEVVKEELRKRIKKMFLMILQAFEEKLITDRYAENRSEKIESPKGFAVMGHPYNYNHLISIFKVFKPDIADLSEDFLRKVFEMAPSYKGSDIHAFKADSGKVVDGCFVMCPIIPDMAVLTPDIVLPKVLAGCRIAEKNGAGVLALGGFTSIVGERFLNVLKEKVKMPITTGNTFTVAMTLAGVRKAMRLMGVDIKQSKVTIIGGTGDIGSACARVLNLEAKEMVITGRTLSSLGKLKEELSLAADREAHVSTDNHQSVKDADIIIAAASSTEPVVDVYQIKSGAIVCDVGYPKNISYHSRYREDILVFSGGLCRVPTSFNIGIDVGLPSEDILYGCWAEAIILSLEERFENFSEGKGLITADNVKWVAEAGEKHGFTIAPFYWGTRMISDAEVRQIPQKINNVA